MTDEDRVMVSMRLPKHMVDEVDKRAKNLGLSRTQWYENMTRWVLANTYTKDGKTERKR